MSGEERDAVKIMAREEARKRIAAANIDALKAKAQMHRDRAEFNFRQCEDRRWENEEDPCTDLLLTAMWELCEATRIETYIDMLKSEEHGMWECIILNRLKPKPRPMSEVIRPAPQWNPDPMRGYKGKECIRFIDKGTQKLARLTFR